MVPNNIHFYQTTYKNCTSNNVSNNVSNNRANNRANRAQKTTYSPWKKNLFNILMMAMIIL